MEFDTSAAQLVLFLKGIFVWSVEGSSILSRATLILIILSIYSVISIPITIISLKYLPTLNTCLAIFKVLDLVTIFHTTTHPTLQQTN